MIGCVLWVMSTEVKIIVTVNYDTMFCVKHFKSHEKNLLLEDQKEEDVVNRSGKQELLLHKPLVCTASLVFGGN